jgi:glyoxylase-like metal-dependent hydrolase (beta-lactamase superfamily II)
MSKVIIFGTERSMLPRKAFGVALVALLGLAALSAQAPPGGGRGGRGGAGQTVEKIRLLKPNLYVITGGGANTLVRVTSDGLIVVDTKNPGDENYNRVMEEIKSVSNLPVTFVLNTHHHPDHVGNNQKFIDAGAKVIGLEALKTRMASDPRTKDIPGPPTITFAKDYVLKSGGVEVHAHSFGRGHTGDDTMVYFPDLKVVMVSDQITDATPIVDFANGGSAVEWPQILDGVLKLDFDMAIPGRGEPKSRADVEAFRTRFASLVSRASDAIKAGATRDTLASQVKTDDLGWQLNPQFFGQLYDELKK